MRATVWYASTDRGDQQSARLFIIEAVRGIGSGHMGLFGLATFNMARRADEIASARHWVP